jgi:hypothetical protein
VSTEALRARALLALSPHADERAHDALARGEVVVVRGVATWAGARGSVEGHKVGLGLSAYDLARLVDAHAARDAIVAAVAAAVASEEGNALAELVLFWSPAAQVETGHYRGAMAAGDLGTAVVEFLRGRGEQAAEAFARTARFTVQGAEVRIEPTPPAPLVEPLQACLRSLLARIDG